MVECEFVFLVNVMHLLARFNRYMVECELWDYRGLCGTFAVLIDTWWNVNPSTVAVIVEQIQF